MSPINWRAKTPPWVYLVLAVIFAINAFFWALLAFRQGRIGLLAASGLVWAIASALWALAYFRWRRKAAK